MNPDRLLAYGPQLRLVLDGLGTRVQVAQTARSEADSGLLPMLEEAEGSGPEGEGE